MQSSFFLNSQLRTLFLSLAILSAVVGCSKKEDATPATLNSVQGNWKVNTFKVDGLGDVTPLLIQQYGMCITDVTLSFNAGGTVGFDNPASCASGTALAAFTTYSGISATSKWSQNGNTLTITPTTGTASTYATTFTATTVQLQGQGLFDFTGSGTKTLYKFTLELRKV